MHRSYCLGLYAGLKVGWYKLVCHTSTSLAGLKPYQHLLFKKFQTSMTFLLWFTVYNKSLYSFDLLTHTF